MRVARYVTPFCTAVSLYYAHLAVSGPYDCMPARGVRHDLFLRGSRGLWGEGNSCLYPCRRVQPGGESLCPVSGQAKAVRPTPQALPLREQDKSTGWRRHHRLSNRCPYNLQPTSRERWGSKLLFRRAAARRYVQFGGIPHQIFRVLQWATAKNQSACRANGLWRVPSFAAVRSQVCRATVPRE